MARPRPLSMDADFDELQTILVVGNSKVGKTSFIKRFTDGTYRSGINKPTIGIDFQMKYFNRGTKRILLQIWDTSGERKYQCLVRQFYGKAMGVILLYDVTDESSFESLGRWVEEIRTYARPSAQIILVGNKCDDLRTRTIPYSDVADYARDLHLPYLEVSAQGNKNVTKLFECLADQIDYVMRLSIEKDLR